MCRMRFVRNYYSRCGHGINQPNEEIKCENIKCKFSEVHPPDCQPPACTKSCWQYRQFPEQYSPNIDAVCPDCYVAGRR